MVKSLASVEGPEPMDLAVGARIRIRRNVLGLTQSQLAEGVGVSFQQVQKYENAGNRVSASMLVKIASALETTVAAIVGEDGQAPVEAIVCAQLATPGAAHLLAAFAEIPEAETRNALLAIVEGLADTRGKTARRSR